MAQGRDERIIALLNQLGDRMIRNEKERAQIVSRLSHLSQHDTHISALEDRANRAEQAFFSLQGKLAHAEESVKALAGRQAELERQSAQVTELARKLEDALSQNGRLSRKLDQLTEDRVRTIRKLERIEEAVLQTREALNAKALVLLTDQASAARAVPAQFGTPEQASREKFSSLFFPAGWRKWDRGLPAAGVAAMVVLALFGGWAVQNSNSGGMTVAPQEIASNDVIVEDAATTPLEVTEAVEGVAHPFSAAPDADAQAVMVEAPQDIAPAAGPVPGKLDLPVKEVDKAAPGITQASLTNGDASLSEKPANEFSDVDRFVAQQKDAKPLAERMKPDNALPPVVKEIEKKAFEGVAEAQHDLAAIYTAGHGGVKPDMKKSVAWFREAAIQGVANARYNLGVLYQQGLGVDKDIDKAIGWYRAAAKGGHPEAQYNLGIAHIEGIGATYDPVLAARFFERAAKGGIVEAAYNLGLIYENGLMGKADRKEALFWYSQAAGRDSPEAKTAMEQLAKVMSVDLKDVSGMYAGRQGLPAIEKPAAQKDGKKDKRAALEAQEPVIETDGKVSQAQTLIAQIQEQLIRMNLYPGPADGIMNVRTADAIRAYQKQSKLDRDARISDALLAHMLAQEEGKAVLAGGNAQEDMPPPGEFAGSN